MPRYYGWKRQQPDHRDYKFQPSHAIMSSLPPSADLTDGMGPVLDQGNLGSCGPNAIDSLWMFDQKKQGLPVVSISRLFGYYTTRFLMGTVGQDSGVDNRTMLRAANQFGECSESLCPYDVSSFTQKPSDAAYTAALANKITNYAAVSQDINSVRGCLASGLPFLFGFTVYESFESAAVEQTGIVPTPGSNERVLGGHDVCFTGDTLVSLMDGTERSLKDLAEGSAGNEFWVYSCDSSGNVVPGLAHSARKTDKKRKLVKVILDNGEEIRCTPDHRFMMRDGTYKEAKDLQPDDSLMPLYRKLSTQKEMTGYEQVYNPATKKWRFTHRIAASREGRYNGGVVHHKDFNKRNNTPDNLEVMSWQDHTAIHAENNELLKQYARSKKGRVQSRQNMNRLWADPEWRAKMIKQLGKNGRAACLKRAAEGRNGFQTWQHEDFVESSRKSGLKRRGTIMSLEVRAKISASHLKRMTDPEIRAEMTGRAHKATEAASYKYQTEGCTDKQITARRQNIKKALAAQDRQMVALKTAYTRFHQDKFKTFEDYLASKGMMQQANNHKVVSVHLDGCEDVYDLTVEKHHNFALTAGVFVHNCICGYDDATQRFKFKNSWGMWGSGGYGWFPYSYVTDPNLSGDFWVLNAIPGGVTPIPTPTPIPVPAPTSLFTFSLRREARKNQSLSIRLPVDLPAGNYDVVAHADKFFVEAEPS